MKIDPVKDVLIVVDVQNDFCPGGALAVPEGDKVVPVINGLLALPWLKVASRDWHPQGHCSFKEQGGPWPPHCIQNTKGAEFHPDLQIEKIDKIISKATTKEKDAYSAFEDTDLCSFLKQKGIQRVFITGLATDYCVRQTTLDALREGFQAVVILDAVKGVDVHPGDSEKALEEMREKGAVLIRATEVKQA